MYCTWWYKKNTKIFVTIEKNNTFVVQSNNTLK